MSLANNYNKKQVDRKKPKDHFMRALEIPYENTKGKNDETKSLPYGEANKLLNIEELNYSDCINIAVLDYMNQFIESMSGQITEGRKL